MTVKITFETDDGTAREIAEAIGKVIAREHQAAQNTVYTGSRRSRLRAVPNNQPELPGSLTAGGDRR